jgi:hypothetical protein
MRLRQSRECQEQSLAPHLFDDLVGASEQW